MTVQNFKSPPHITAHFHAPHSQRTDQSLQKSCNLANAPKPTHHPKYFAKNKKIGDMKNIFLLATLLLSVLSSSITTTCANNNGVANNQENKENYSANSNDMEKTKIKIKVNSQTFSATLADNKSAQAFKEMLPLTLKMADHLRNEKHTDLSKSLPTNSSNPQTVQNGDLMLFGSRTLVLFYKTFATSYSYTRLGKVDDAAGLASALGSGSVTVTFELEK